MSIDHKSLREEFRQTGASNVMREFVDFFSDESAAAEELKTRTGVHVSMLDLGLLSYVLNWFAIEGRGTRPQSLIDTFPAPRRTIRDGLKRLVTANLLTKEGSAYFPSPEAIAWMNNRYERDYEKIERLAEAFVRFREKIDRKGR